MHACSHEHIGNYLGDHSTSLSSIKLSLCTLVDSHSSSTDAQELKEALSYDPPSQAYPNKLTDNMKSGIKGIIYIVDNVESAIYTAGEPMKAQKAMPETHVVAAHGWVLVKLPENRNECVLQKTSVTFINGEATRKPLIDELARRSSEGEYSVLYLSHVYSNSES